MRLAHRQQGMTLFMALIMLIVLTLLALASFNQTQANMQVVTNMQQRDAAQFAARGVLEEIISNNRFNETPTTTLLAQTGCTGANKRCIDTNGDSVSDVEVSLTATPTCVKTKLVKTSDLNMNLKEEQNCSNGASTMNGMENASTGDSLCADSVWEVQAQAVDTVSSATVTVTQGVAVRIPADKIIEKCPG